jgi:hypothetical protein
MNILKLKPVTTSAAICALSLALSTTAFAAGGMRTGGSVNANSSMRTTTSAQATTLRSMPTKPLATSTKTTTTAHTTGQPNQSCGSATAPNTPGNSAAAPGSAFNPDGKSGTVYAGQQPQNSNNPNSVSQYDVACAKQP